MSVQYYAWNARDPAYSRKAGLLNPRDADLSYVESSISITKVVDSVSNGRHESTFRLHPETAVEARHVISRTCMAYRFCVRAPVGRQRFGGRFSFVLKR